MKRDMERRRREMEERMKNLSSSYNPQSASPYNPQSAYTPQPAVTAQKTDSFKPQVEALPSAEPDEGQGSSTPATPLLHHPGLENESESKLAMFEKLYASVYSSGISPKSFAAFGYSDTDLSPLANLLAGIGEIELYEALYQFADEILPEPWVRNQTCYGDFIKFIERERVEKYLTRHDINPKILAKQLKEIKEIRNSCNHKGVVTLAVFDRFFQKTYVKFFNDTLPLIIRLKKKPFNDSYGIETGYLESYSKNQAPAKDWKEYLKQIAKAIAGGSTSGIIADVKSGSAICVVLTDTVQLSIKLYRREGESSKIRSDLEMISNRMSEIGRQYILVDASDEKWKNFFKEDKGWQSYVRMLDNIYDLISQDNPEALPHLLILGGDDVIPMPRLLNPARDHFLEGGWDQPLENTLETDIIYSYGSDSISFHRNGELNIEKLFLHKPSFFVGRLPLESGLISTQYYEGILQYFISDIEYAGNKMRVNKIGAVTMECCSNISRLLFAGLPLADLSHIDEAYAQNNIFRSPGIELGAMPAKISNLYINTLRDCDLLTFLTHGSPDPSSTVYTGQPTGKKEYPAAFVPDILEDSKVRIMAPISCWGARFIGYERSKSILLQSLYNHGVMVFIGSSRTSFGKHDSWPKIGFGQAIVRSFILNLLAGMSAGEAMLSARLSILRNVEEINMLDLLTVQEFNLFGDPMFRLAPTMSTEKYGIGRADEILDLENKDVVVDTKVIYRKDAGKPSILDRVRNLVDSNLNSIRSRLNDMLYKQYNIEGRDLSIISRYTTKNGREGMNFVYKHESDFVTSYTIARTDSEGNLEDVIQSF